MFRDGSSVGTARKALKRASRGLVGPWKRYETKGGGGEFRWSAAGIMKKQVGVDGRIVLEALASKAFPEIVIRVFSEEPLVTHYARKVVSPSDMDGCMAEAGGIYDRIPGEGFQGSDPLGSMFNFLLRGALNPLPPPFDIDEIEVFGQA